MYTVQESKDRLRNLTMQRNLGMYNGFIVSVAGPLYTQMRKLVSCDYITVEASIPNGWEQYPPVSLKNEGEWCGASLDTAV